jgi:hypothetical protein
VGVTRPLGLLRGELPGVRALMVVKGDDVSVSNEYKTSRAVSTHSR